MSVLRKEGMRVDLQAILLDHLTPVPTLILLILVLVQQPMDTYRYLLLLVAAVVHTGTRSNLQTNPPEGMTNAGLMSGYLLWEAWKVLVPD